MYRSLVFVCCGIMIVYADLSSQQREEFYSLQTECMKETGTTDDMIRRAFGGDFPDVPIFKEHLVCIGRKSGVIDEDGNYHKELLKEGLIPFVKDEEAVERMLEKCYVVMDSLPELAFRMTKCLYHEHFGM